MHLNGNTNNEQNKPYIFTYIEESLNKIHESLKKFSLQPYVKINSKIISMI